LLETQLIFKPGVTRKQACNHTATVNFVLNFHIICLAALKRSCTTELIRQLDYFNIISNLFITENMG